MNRFLIFMLLCLPAQPGQCWGFYGHQKINYYAVFLLPPQMIRFYKQHIGFLSEHAVDPDKRRYAVPEEGPRHYIDLDHYGILPLDSFPRKWEDAVLRLGADSLSRHGIVPWWVQIMQRRLTAAFRDRDGPRILKLSAEIGHYIADAHVPLHASSNHNGQYTGQLGIHGFWESRLPELLAQKEWDFFIGRASYIAAPGAFIWQRVLESGAASDTVLRLEKELSGRFPPDQKFAFEERSGRLVRQYSTAYAIAYDRLLGGMVERRMRASIGAVASFWYTAWIDAGQPDLDLLPEAALSESDLQDLQALDKAWKEGKIIGRKEE